MTRFEGRRDRLFEATDTAAKFKDSTQPDPTDDPDRYRVKTAYPARNVQHQLDSGAVAKLTSYFGGHFAESFGIRPLAEPTRSDEFDSFK